MDDEDSLVRRRSRRSTAGNRMEAALAEMSIEDTQEGDDDRDFVADVADEGDIFGSDFESTDDEAARVVSEMTDKVAIKHRLERATAAAAARQRVTFNPDAAESASMHSSEPEKKRRKVSLGVAVNAETGQPVSVGRRQSGRSLTALARTASLARLVEEAKQKSSTPKKAKAKEKPPTQDELLKRALDMEDGNIEAHRNYLANEEERRKRAHVVRTAVEGPLVRWVSRREVIVLPLPEEHAPVSNALLPVSLPSIPATTPPFAGTLTGSYVVPFQPGAQQSLYTTLFPPEPTSNLASSLPTPSAPPPQSPTPPPLTETVARQYVVHEVSQEPNARPPSWKETMTALFGDHVAWEELRVFTAKNRPLSRPVLVCPITGLPAPYRDPCSGVPFANREAYTVLMKILNYDYVWCAELGCYVTPFETVEDIDPNEKSGSKDRERSASGGRRRGR
ncbi:YL1 nuclear protein-domain-containing protein [Vararia minispora EC-137]|uniref:YL1 nuclear protein-domain-containing protein n=1 Tax=Vararia minispora EC-137 TaxID=1314806 RepID=A0ACB8Q604_9AGAM|nr:YL1 nuclear protein-domain-containing protein [Vararia minispora EC-137]